MTPLDRLMREIIAQEGPQSLERVMSLALGHPGHGYYMTRDPFGVAGDFVTAPEVSQMFGELIGLWCADLWSRAGRPEPVHYVELGPGRGTLARDALRAGAQHGFSPSVHFVESSPALRDAQLAVLPQAHWHDDLSTAPQTGAVLIVANEFLDALPVRQLVKGPQGWRERVVGSGGVGAGGPVFVPLVGDRPMDAAVPEDRREAEDGAIIETCPGAAAVMYEVAGRLLRQGGAALFIDYGYDAPQFGSTLQAVRDHRKVDPFAAPGEADLTAHVDFAALSDIACSRGVKWLGTVPQGQWLKALGIDVRAAALAQAAPDQADAIRIALDRLVSEEQMGTLFKVMALAAPEWPDGVGFP